MLLDLRKLPDGQEWEADLCIVGAGPAGIALARALLDSKLRIVLLESGGLQIDPATQALNAGEITGLAHGGVLEGRGRAFGGSARLWAGQCLRLDPIDFAQREWVAHSGWPLSAAQLDPWYRRAEAFFQIPGPPYDKRLYQQFGLLPPDWAHDALHTHFTIYTPQVDTGRCHLAALRRAPGIRVVTHAQVVRIETNNAVSQVAGVYARSLSGRGCSVRARTLVLCAGALENARLLLSSRQQQSTGLGNGRDLVGRFFQDHPNGLVATVAGGDLQDRFRLLYRRGRRFFPKFALSAERQRREGVLNGNAHLVFAYDEQPAVGVMRDLLESARRRQLPRQPWRQAALLAGDAGSLAPLLWRRFVRGRSPAGVPRSVRLQCYLEQAPDPASRVCLSEQLDPFGVPRLQLDWRLTGLEQATLRTLAGTAREEFRRLGLGDMQVDPWVEAPSDAWKTRLVDCYHHAGTTRMAEDPSQGVVDPDGQVFGISGLYLCGGSVFPTSGYANPTLTIVALALRLAGHLRQLLHTPALPERAAAAIGQTADRLAEANSIRGHQVGARNA